MAIYEILADGLKKVDETSFSEEGIRERADLQRLLRDSVEVVSPDTLVISEEFGEWQDSRRRIDLLGVSPLPYPGERIRCSGVPMEPWMRRALCNA